MAVKQRTAERGTLIYKKGRKEKYRYGDRVITVKYDKPKTKRRKRKATFADIVLWCGIAIIGYLIVSGMGVLT